jgi:hypothetical protein
MMKPAFSFWPRSLAFQDLPEVTIPDIQSERTEISAA